MSQEVISQVVKMSTKEVVSKLQSEADKNPCFNAVCHVFAVRERARQQVTLSTLKIRMAKEKFDFPINEYEKVLKFLAQLGIGRLLYDDKGCIIALKDIKTTLQSIGNTALHKSEKLNKFTPITTFVDLPQEKRQAATPSPVKNPGVVHPTVLTVNIDGSAISFPIPKGVTVEELGEILSTVYSKSRNRDVQN